FRMVSIRSMLILTSLITISFSCSCIESTPEKIYCMSEFVSKVRVDDEWTKSQFTAYTVKHLQIFKHPKSTDNATLVKWVYTAPQSAACGVRLTKGDDVILAGSVRDGHLFINDCAEIDPSFDTRAFENLNCTTTDMNSQ
ncbi:hypothetical protein PENTCL1PPCAC_21357, partial [Pristionchus entomophagus]